MNPSVKMYGLKKAIQLPFVGKRSFSVLPQTEELSKHHSLLPGFKKYPILGTLPSVVTDKYFDKYHIDVFWRSAFDRFGPVVQLKNPGTPPVIAIVSPEDTEVVCRSTLNHPVRHGMSSLRKVRREAKNNFYQGKTGLLTENHDEWKRVRTRVNFPVMDMKNVQSYVESMDEVALDFVDRITQFQEECGEMPSDFLEEIYKWALESVGTVAFNCRFGCLEKNLAPGSLQNNLIDAVNNVFVQLGKTELGAKFWKFLPTPNIIELQKHHNRFIDVVCEAERFAKKINEHKTRKGLLDELRKIPGFSNLDVTTFLVDMISGGIDTTSHAAGFTLYLLAQNPRVQTKLRQEVDSVLGDRTQLTTANMIKNMPYLKNCVRESLRVFPIVVGFPRSLVEDVILSGYKVPKGHGVFCVNMVTSGHESYFKQPKEFIPERWQKDRPLGPIHPFAHLPFAHGTRMCIGKRISEQELYILIARIVQKFNIEYHYEDIEAVTRLVSLPSRPLKLSFKQRD